MKRTMILVGLLMFLNVAALASVDAIVLGSEDVDDKGTLQGPPAMRVQSNEVDLYSAKHLPDDDGSDDGDESTLSGSSAGGDIPPNEGNAPVPEPATGVLLSVGVLGLARMLRRKPSGDGDE